MRIISPNKKLFALIYGQSGSGKTHLAITYCLMHPDQFVLLVDADQGSETAEAPEFKKIKNLIIVDFEIFKDLDQLLNLCEKNTIEGWIKVLPELKGILTAPFSCIVFDTWTQLQWMLLTELRKRNNRLGMGLDFRQNIEIQHWQQMTDLNKKSIEAFKELPMEFLFLMQQAIVEDKITGALVKGPAIHGKLVQELPAFFSTVIYTYTSPSGEFRATTVPKLGWPAKVRGKQGKDINNPTLKELLE